MNKLTALDRATSRKKAKNLRIKMITAVGVGFAGAYSILLVAAWIANQLLQ